MGVETDYIAGTDEQIDEIWASLNPAGDFSGVYGKGSDPVSLSMLHCCIAGKDFDLSIMDQFEPIRMLNDGERILLEVPHDIRASIDSIKDENVTEIVSRWAETEEYELTGWADDVATEFLSALSAYSRDNASKKLFMWICV